MERIATPTSTETHIAHSAAPSRSGHAKGHGRTSRLVPLLPWLAPAGALVVIVDRLGSLTPNIRGEFLAGMAAVFCALAALAILLIGVKRGLMMDD